jgi:phospholipase C
MDLTSEWAATCTNSTDAMSCNSDTSPVYPQKGTITLPWANLFQLLDVHKVSWKTYIGAGIEPDCADGDMVCPARPQAASTASIWNVAPLYAWVQAAGATYLANHVQPATRFLSDLQANTLPQVSWIVPTAANSEHPPASITLGMEYVTALVNGVMQSRAAAETVIFIAWDDWGGFYDHLPPPNVDTNQTAYPIQGYGLRVPGIMISLHAKKGYIDHSVLSFDSYARFFEDLFANSARLDPAALGNPDNRPDIRDEINSVTFVGGATQRVGDLLDEFDFSQPKLPRLVLSTAIPFHLSANCKASTNTLLCTAANVVLTWDAIPIGATGTPPYSYQVTRDGAPLTACLTTATRCVDVVPASGAHLYRIHSVDSAGIVSPDSAAVEADLP